MNLKQVDTILLVKNIETSKHFYSEVLKLEILHDWGAMVVYKERLALHQADLLQPIEETIKFVQAGVKVHANVVIYLASDNLDECQAALKDAGVLFVHEIIQLPWERVFRIFDPDHYVIEIGEPH